MAKKQLIGKAALTLCRTDTGSVAYVYAGRPVPSGILPEERTRLLKEEFLEEVDLADDDDGDDDSTATPSKPAVADVKKAVGDDPAKAREALDAELALPEADRRPTLVTHLEGIIAKADGS